MGIIEWIVEWKVQIIVVVVALLLIFRKYVFGMFKKKELAQRHELYQHLDVPPIPPAQAESPSEDPESERDRYEKELRRLDSELKKAEADTKRLNQEYTNTQTFLLHKRRQLSLQYNTYLNNLKNVEKMIEYQEEMKKAIKKK